MKLGDDMKVKNARILKVVLAAVAVAAEGDIGAAEIDPLGAESITYCCTSQRYSSPSVYPFF